MDAQEWLDKDSELVLAYIRKLKVEFKDEPSIATVVNGAMIRAEHCGVFYKPQEAKPTSPPTAPTGPAANTNAWGSGPIKCPQCGTSVNPRVSKATGKTFYKCDVCTAAKGDGGATFINQDGRVYHNVGDTRAKL